MVDFKRGAWLDRIDPGAHRRVKGLRLATAFGLAAMLATMPGIAEGRGPLLGVFAAGFALWASVSESQATRYESARDLLILCLAAGIGAAIFVAVRPVLGPVWDELTLVTGAFCVGYLRRYGVLGAGVGSQIFIGQLLAFTSGAALQDLGTIALATSLAGLAAIVPRLLSGPAEKPALSPRVDIPADGDIAFTESVMGLQAAFASLIIVVLGQALGLTESAWAIAACTYVVTGSLAGTIDRIRRRVAGTLVGVPLGLACLPIAAHAPLIVWVAAAFAMIIYSMALPEHYEVACGAYAFALVVTMGASGEYPAAVLVARGWETILGGAIGIAVVLLFAKLPFARQHQC
ncbi:MULTISPECIES: FUSC family protein [unclassified Bradyrhizobium]|uniref:FUSC family protein n=1 Tax=unclassified Bradyrhizobium TaxID=2631580 RepID=UPI0006789EB1|nr:MULTISPECIES: FUSC family protein [unclassified Bradyrhizobium]